MYMFICVCVCMSGAQGVRFRVGDPQSELASRPLFDEEESSNVHRSDLGFTIRRNLMYRPSPWSG